MNSCEIIEVFYNIRIDLDKLNYASQISKIITEVTNENENSYKVLQLLLNTLYIISQSDKDLNLILSIFKIRLSCILGFSPNIHECTQCKIKEGLNFFSFKNNGFKCNECSKHDKSAIHINDTTACAIRYIITSPAKKLYSFNVPNNCIKELQIISKIYLNEKLEKIS